MPSLDEVYRKFGQVAESGQIVETSLGNIVLPHGLLELMFLVEERMEDGETVPRFVVDSGKATPFIEQVNRKTFGQLLQAAKPHIKPDPNLELLLGRALKERNRLTHSFYRQHNLRRNTDAGRSIMLADLEAIHAVLLDAMRALSLLDGIDLDAIVNSQGQDPKRHRKLDKNVVHHLPI